MGWLSGARQAAYARRDLDALAARLASAGLSTAGLGPGLLADVDQHAAAVRDILEADGGRAGLVELAAYAQGALDAAAERGCAPEQGPEPDSWIVLRLLAVCALADAPFADDRPGLDPLLPT
ncbi:hypothetical protein B1813_03785 [Saccharomonospora piscinae]|uniref:Uncharacterized protein n=1 Tax=Saccharomonospora piscinae TaxID=687388 RepID=A0A1V9A9B3_SACPI|nr:DUF6401 family natural product biosynthesis protein [Saccharomonospora piscinae]OQO93671.1 hypothetical protein B1813_03785 [Saccharomonospora piscinae]TLW94831.1 hypothetical protein FFT09_02920 [Saccharomonospora piscinae]